MPSATFTNDELILVLISLVRATRPSMLKPDGDGFSLDFEPLTKKKKLTPDERLLMRMREVMDAPADPSVLVLELDAKEAARLAATLARLETLQKWPDDVLQMSRALRTRLASVT